MLRMRVFLFVFFFSFSALAQESREEKLRAFADFVAAEMKAQQITGLSVALRDGDFTWASGFGSSDIENDVPATAQSSYRTGSLAKPMTALAVLSLAEDGKIDLDAEVQTYVPYFPHKKFPVTVRQLLTHQGGISHYRNYDVEGRIRDPKTTQEAIAIFADWDLVAEPGTAMNYTSYGYNLLGAVIEGASGQPYATVLRERVWQPLGMTATRMDDPRAIVPHRVPGYVREEGTLRRSEYVDVSSRLGGGGTRSTVEDLVRLFDGVAQGKVLKAATRERAWSMQPTRDGRLTRYGYGFGILASNGRYVVAHTGSQQETRTAVMIVPVRRFCVALASNYENIDLSPFEDKLVELFLGDAWYIRARGRDAATTAMAETLFAVYNYGLAYYDRHGRAMTTDARELDAAFAYVREALAKRDPKKIADGVHPVAGEPFTKAGSYVASILGNRDVYHRDGALRFFADYVRVAHRHRLDRFAENITLWNEQWSRLWTPELRAMRFSDPDAALTILEQLAPEFEDATIRPDYTRELEGLPAAYAERATKIRKRLYP